MAVLDGTTRMSYDNDEPNNYMQKLEDTNNPIRLAQTIAEQEGASVLFSGVYERCIGAVPRFGITLGVHAWLEQYAAQAGLLS